MTEALARTRVCQWKLSDDGHLSHSLWGVPEEKLRERVAVVAGDLPVVLQGGALVADLVGESNDENLRILGVAVEAALAGWALRLDQAVPSVEVRLKDAIAQALHAAGIATHPNLEIRGRTGLSRRFDLGVGDAGRGLLRAAAPVVLIRVGQWQEVAEEMEPGVWRRGNCYQPGISSEEVIDSARGWWKINPRSIRRRGIRHAVAVYDGVTRMVLEIGSWTQRDDGRWAFAANPVLTAQCSTRGWARLASV